MSNFIGQKCNIIKKSLKVEFKAGMKVRLTNWIYYERNRYRVANSTLECECKAE